jgi:hypothetical protein
MEAIIQAEALTTFDISADGSRIRFNARDQHGAVRAFELPANCLTQMLATIPKIIQEAQRRQHHDSSLRVTYPLDTFGIELGEADADGIRQYILTLKTTGPFEISFATPAVLLGALAQSVIDQVLTTESASLTPVTLNS